MTDLLYIIYVLCYFFVCYALSYALVRLKRRLKLQAKLPLKDVGFCERLPLINGCMYLVLYIVITTFFSGAIAMTGNKFLIQNQDFVAYLLLFVCGAAIMYIFYKQAIKSVKNNLEQNISDSLIIMLPAVAAMALLLVVLPLFMGVESQNQNSVQSWQTNIVIKIVTVCLFGPIVEEAVYRGIIFRLLRKDTKVFAHVAAAVFFGLEHCIYYVLGGDISQLIMFLPYTALGLGFSVMYERTHNICYPTIAHIFVNMVSVCFSF